ncbi:hypothetical protein QN277_001140 [Acacia crassicarpa]|nr:hypothetical protein QN277_001140 [Acacia crassicarpa]
MSKSWKGSTEPDIEKSDSFANHGSQFSGDTEVRTRGQVPLKKLCQRGYIMIGTIPVQLQPPYSMNLQGSSSSPSLNFSSTCTEPRSMSNPLRSVQSNIRVMHTNVDKTLLPDFSPSSVSNNSLSPAERFPASNISRHQGKSSCTDHLWKSSEVGYVKRPRPAQRNLNNALAGYKVDPADIKPFDICFRRRHNSGLDISLHANTKSYTEVQEGVTEKIILKPGMVLLKHYLSHTNQVEIVRICRKLGQGPGGFYQPGYKDGAKLRLQMMCLGLDWDPQTRKYGNKRSIDGCEPPNIPDEFRDLAILAIEEAQNVSKKKFRAANVEDVLPSMSPDLCIVNFYSAHGRLGLHQDRDESRDSLHRGLPVVSFSVGDSAEFLYGEERDLEKAEKVVLESGDVLIFGGKSRFVFHGVSCIIPNSAPRELLEATGLRPGRLNLTFRQF